MPIPIRESIAGIDCTARVFSSNVVVASPALAAETIICSVTITGDISVQTGVWIFGYYAATIGTSGTAAQSKLRRTNVSGSTVLDSGATTQAAGTLFERSPMAFDTFAAGNGQIYVMTLTVPSGAATSTVSAAQLIVLAI